MSTGIAERLESIENRIAAACERAGRDPSEIELVAVSKKQDPDKIRASLHRYIAADVLPIVGDADRDRQVLIDKKDLAHSDFESLYFVRALAVFGVEDAYVELLDFLSHPDPTIRSRAAFAMAETWHFTEEVLFHQD